MKGNETRDLIPGEGQGGFSGLDRKASFVVGFKEVTYFIFCAQFLMVGPTGLIDDTDVNSDIAQHGL